MAIKLRYDRAALKPPPTQNKDPYLPVDAHELLAAPKSVVAFGADHLATIMSPGTLLSVSLAVDL